MQAQPYISGAVSVTPPASRDQGPTSPLATSWDAAPLAALEPMAPLGHGAISCLHLALWSPEARDPDLTLKCWFTF